MPTLTFYQTTESGPETFAIIALLPNDKLTVKSGPSHALELVTDFQDHPSAPDSLLDLLAWLPTQYTGSYLRAAYSDTITEVGGPGSGHHGHSGRPGQRGGSLPGKSGSASSSNPDDAKFLQTAPNSTWLNTHDLGAGVANAFQIDYEDGVKGVCKRANQGDHQGYSEVGAYEVSQALGFDDLVPATIWTKVMMPPGDATSQRFIEGATPGWRRGAVTDPSPELITRARQIMILDTIIATPDRHGGNYVFDPSDRLFAVDHGHARWVETNATMSVCGSLFAERFNLGHSIKLNESELSRLRSLNESAFTSRLTGTGVPPDMAESAWANVQRLIKSKKITWDEDQESWDL